MKKHNQNIKNCVFYLSDQFDLGFGLDSCLRIKIRNYNWFLYLAGRDLRWSLEGLDEKT